jgi:hypothetical protein
MSTIEPGRERDGQKVGYCSRFHGGHWDRSTTGMLAACAVGGRSADASWRLLFAPKSDHVTLLYGASDAKGRQERPRARPGHREERQLKLFRNLQRDRSESTEFAE